jgi:hypothetical protein
MTELILVRQTIYVEGIECTVTELVPMYPRLKKYHGPFAKIIALPGSTGSQSEAPTKATAARPSCLLAEMEGGCVDGVGTESGRG